MDMDKITEALIILKDNKMITIETARYLNILGECYELSGSGHLHHFIAYSQNWYSKKEQGKVGFKGGMGIEGEDVLKIQVGLFKITAKGHCALRDNFTPCQCEPKQDS